MNSKQGSRYIKRRMGNDLKQKILAYNGIVPNEEINRKNHYLVCPRCEIINSAETKYCSKCSYPLVPAAFDEIKESEENRLRRMEEQIKMLTDSRKEMLECIKFPAKLAELASE